MSERYQRLDCIGGGGYADVYRARDTVDNKIVAQKVLRTNTPENFRRFKREHERLKAYHANQHIVNLLDADLKAKQPFLILEYSELGSLEKYVTNRGDWKQVVKWMRDISRALTAIHASGYWHRDIKPSNILLFRDDEGNIIAKITDFGLAPKRDNSSGPMTNSPFGTKGYIDPMAPFFGFKSSSDIFSLGKTIQELLTGDKDNSTNYPQDTPFKLRVLISRMMNNFSQDARPTALEIFNTVTELLQPPVPMQGQVSQYQPIGWKGLLTVVGIGLGVAALLGTNDYDDNVGRYRDSLGRFASGMF
jgi:serine/threonine protein kinase